MYSILLIYSEIYLVVYKSSLAAAKTVVVSIDPVASTILILPNQNRYFLLFKRSQSKETHTHTHTLKETKRKLRSDISIAMIIEV